MTFVARDKKKGSRINGKKLVNYLNYFGNDSLISEIDRTMLPKIKKK